MIFNNDRLASHANRFAKKRHWINHMVKNIHEHHAIEARIIIRKRLAVKLGDGDEGFWANENVDAQQLEVRSPVANKTGNQTIATSHI